MSDFHFSDFTPDFILDAIESIGIVTDSGLLALNSYENRVYQFRATDSLRYVVKFYRGQRWTPNQIQEELDFALELKAHELNVAAPVLVEANSLHQFKLCNFAIFPSVGGRQFEIDSVDQIERAASMIGRIHAIGATHNFTHRPSMDIDRLLSDCFTQIERSLLIPDALRIPFVTVCTQLIELLKLRWQHNYAAIRLHGDCHPGNILWNGEPIFVDFDDCCNGPAMQDIWMMLSGDRQNQLIQLDTIAEAYDAFHPFPTEQLQLIEPLRALRMIKHLAWLDKRWQDPAFPRAFPWFCDGKYWEQQILAFKEQLASLHEPPLCLFR